MAKVTELIGKTCLRSEGVTYPNGVTDRSYTSGNPVKILGVSEHHFVILSFGKSYLDRALWDDGKWHEVPEI